MLKSKLKVGKTHPQIFNLLKVSNIRIYLLGYDRVFILIYDQQRYQIPTIIRHKIRIIAEL